MEELTQGLQQLIISLLTVLGTLVAIFRFYLPRRERNHVPSPSNPGDHSNPGDRSLLEDLLREVRAGNKANSDHHAREVEWHEEYTRTFTRIETKQS